MMWDRIIQAMMAEVGVDATLVGIFMTNIRLAPTSGELIVPSLEVTLVGDTENELWAPMIVQLDLWTESPADSRTAERVLRRLYHRDLQRTLGTFVVTTVFNDATILAVPDRANYSGRALRFQITPLREQYAGVVSDDVGDDEIILDGGGA